MRRSTTGTRAWGGAALVWAAVAALLPLSRYGAPTPRWDVLAALGAALLCGLGWVAATWRAPRFVPAPPEDRPADDAARLPARLPHPPLVSLARGLAGALAGYALVSALLLAWQPDGRQARTLAALQDAGATVSTGTITAVTSQEESNVGVSGQKFGSYWYASFTAELSDGTRLPVDRGIVAGVPSGWREVEVLHVPGRPELGGWVDDSTDITAYVRTWRPPFAAGPWFLTAFAVAASLAHLGRRSGRFGPHRVLAEDAAAGRVKAFRVDTLTAVRNEHTTVGSRAGTTQVVVHRSLRASGERGKLELHVPDADIPALAAEFGASGGWLMWANRWRLVRESRFVPCFFVAPDGRVFRCTAYPKDLARLREREVASERSTDPSVTVRDWAGLCGTSLAVRLLLVVLHTAVAACALPALTGTASHLTGYLPLAAAGVAAAVTGYLVKRPAATDDLPVWERRRSRDRRVRRAEA
ncbi:hypothetical protein ACFFUA_15890 [Streptomyces heliomycini]|uniref:PH domain-containing protein n=1 Tax=Streptomyces heliomycini TaxID=284032 RepID=A0ABV5L9U1_9ACTN